MAQHTASATPHGLLPEGPTPSPAPGSAPSRLSLWWMAARPKTLSAAAVPVLVGVAVALLDGLFRPLPALAALLGAFLIQVGTNLANDYYDFKKGADTEERLGPTRVTQAGLIAPDAVFRAMVLTFAASALVGLYLVWIGGWPIVVIGLLSIASGVAYTGGPWPLGYNGLGDLFVFVFFGLVATVGTYWVQALEWSWLALAAAVPVGLLSTAILVVNNLRDADTDALAGKRTLAVRFGKPAARAEYVALVVLAFASAGLVAWLAASPWPLLSLLAFPLAIRGVRSVLRDEGPVLNDTLALTAKLLALHGLLLAVGIALPALAGAP
ncbi:MAG: 1,4-dihydroxy-2-naphthoate polyprenyltransferase [Deltaproteobacteria bacterium]|nr:MAG: 1,4-dihydroxy-2-naphthoate polyprenyltransferase [Deltaproteobacteria bacterium]